MSRYLEVGKIVGTFGIKGELKFYSESDFITKRLATGNTLFFKKEDTYEPVTISSSREHQNIYIITINNLNNINDVMNYIGLSLYVDTTTAEKLKPGEYYCDDLIGKQVYNQNQELLGTVSDIIEIPSSKLLEVDTGKKKFLVPFVKAFIKEIDDQTIIIEEIEGLR